MLEDSTDPYLDITSSLKPAIHWKNKTTQPFGKKKHTQGTDKKKHTQNEPNEKIWTLKVLGVRNNHGLSGEKQKRVCLCTLKRLQTIKVASQKRLIWAFQRTRKEEKKQRRTKRQNERNEMNGNLKCEARKSLDGKFCSRFTVMSQSRFQSAAFSSSLQTATPTI